MAEISLEIESIAQDGRGIGKCADPAFPQWAGMVVFTRGALPGQTVRAQILRQKGNFAEAQSLAIFKDDPSFGDPFCPRQGQCGGCPLQRMPYARQLVWKERLAKEALTRVGKLDAAQVDALFEKPLASPDLVAFRNKLEFAFGQDCAGQLFVGQRRPGSLDVLKIPECPLLPKGHGQIIQAFCELAQKEGLKAWQPAIWRQGKTGQGYLRHLVLRHAEKSWLLALITSPGKKDQRRAVERIARDLRGRFAEISGFVHEERSANDLWRHGGKRIFSFGETTLVQKLCGRYFSLDASSFCQVNPGSAELLARLVLEMTQAGEDGSLLDLYCGIGSPGQLLASRFANVLGVDSQAASIAMAQKNAADLPNCAYKCQSAEKFLQKNSSAWHTVLIDPPRSGLGSEAVKNIIRARPAQIIYISCNPVTFARDAALLQGPCKLDRLASVDMFPHTPHLECCSRWTIRDA